MTQNKDSLFDRPDGSQVQDERKCDQRIRKAPSTERSFRENNERRFTDRRQSQERTETGGRVQRPNAREDASEVSETEALHLFDYERGLEDAEKLCEAHAGAAINNSADEFRYGYEMAKRLVSAIRALKPAGQEMVPMVTREGECGNAEADGRGLRVQRSPHLGNKAEGQDAHLVRSATSANTTLLSSPAPADQQRNAPGLTQIQYAMKLAEEQMALHASRRDAYSPVSPVVRTLATALLALRDDRDAARYRWLRDGDRWHRKIRIMEIQSDGSRLILCDQFADEAIDVALKEEK